MADKKLFDSSLQDVVYSIDVGHSGITGSCRKAGKEEAEKDA